MKAIGANSAMVNIIRKTGGKKAPACTMTGEKKRKGIRETSSPTGTSQIRPIESRDQRAETRLPIPVKVSIANNVTVME